MRAPKKGVATICSTVVLLAAGIAGCAVERAPAPPTMALVLFDTCTKPDYPIEAARQERVGTVTLMFYVEPDGTVSDSRIATSAGDASLDEAAYTALKACRFKPATENGRPVAKWTTVKYIWSMEDEDGRPIGQSGK